jgi:hypothetical protein
MLRALKYIRKSKKTLFRVPWADVSLLELALDVIKMANAICERAELSCELPMSENQEQKGKKESRKVLISPI